VNDIPAAFLHVDMKDTVHMVLQGTIVEHIVKLKPTFYRKYKWQNKKSTPMLYVQLKNALYGMLQVALLSDTLIIWGFTINPYDQFVANKLIKGKKCTIIWHVENLKILYGTKTL